MHCISSVLCNIPQRLLKEGPLQKGKICISFWLLIRVNSRGYFAFWKPSTRDRLSTIWRDRLYAFWTDVQQLTQTHTCFVLRISHHQCPAHWEAAEWKHCFFTLSIINDFECWWEVALHRKDLLKPVGPQAFISCFFVPELPLLLLERHMQVYQKWPYTG